MKLARVKLISGDTAMPNVKSSHLKHVAYDAGKKTTTITFKDGSKHAFENVPVIEYNRLINAESVGSHFHDEFKNNYRSHKL